MSYCPLLLFNRIGCLLQWSRFLIRFPDKILRWSDRTWAYYVWVYELVNIRDNFNSIHFIQRPNLHDTKRRLFYYLNETSSDEMCRLRIKWNLDGWGNSSLKCPSMDRKMPKSNVKMLYNICYHVIYVMLFVIWRQGNSLRYQSIIIY